MALEYQRDDEDSNIGLGDLHKQLEAMCKSVGACANGPPSNVGSNDNVISSPTLAIPTEGMSSSPGLQRSSVQSFAGNDGLRPTSGLSPRSPRLPVLEALSQRRSIGGQSPRISGTENFRMDTSFQLTQASGIERSMSGKQSNISDSHRTLLVDEGTSREVKPSESGYSPRLANYPSNQQHNIPSHHSVGPNEGDGLLEKLLKGLENKEMSVGDALGALEHDLGKPGTTARSPRQSDSRSMLDALRSGAGVSPRTSGEQGQSNTGLSPRPTGALGRSACNEEMSPSVIRGGSGSGGTAHRSSMSALSPRLAVTKELGMDVQRDPVETWIGSSTPESGTAAETARIALQMSPMQTTPRKQEKCGQCEVLGMQVRALVQSLVGLGARIFNWAAILNTGQHRALAELVLEYTRPCAHLDDVLKGLCAEIEAVAWDKLAESKPPSEQISTSKADLEFAVARSTTAAIVPPKMPLQTKTPPELSKRSHAKDDVVTNVASKKNPFFRRDPGTRSSATQASSGRKSLLADPVLENFFAEPRAEEDEEEDVDDDSLADLGGNYVTGNFHSGFNGTVGHTSLDSYTNSDMMATFGARGIPQLQGSIKPLAADEPPAPLAQSEPLAPPRHVSSRHSARSSQQCEPLAQPPPLQRSPRRDQNNLPTESSLSGEMNPELCRALVRQLQAKNSMANSQERREAPSDSIGACGGGTGEPECIEEPSDEDGDDEHPPLNSNVYSAKHVFSQMMSPGTKAGSGEAAFRPACDDGYATYGQARPLQVHAPSENLRNRSRNVCRDARDDGDSSDSDLHF